MFGTFLLNVESDSQILLQAIPGFKLFHGPTEGSGSKSKPKI